MCQRDSRQLVLMSLLYSCEASLCAVRRLTVDHHSGGRAASLGHDVAGHACVISRIRQLGLGDDETVVTRFLREAFRDESIVIFQPFHLKHESNTCLLQTLFLFFVVPLLPAQMLIERLSLGTEAEMFRRIERFLGSAPGLCMRLFPEGGPLIPG